MVLEHERDHPSRWVPVVSITQKIGCVPQTQTLHEWVKKAEVDADVRAVDRRCIPPPRPDAIDENNPAQRS